MHFQQTENPYPSLFIRFLLPMASCNRLDYPPQSLLYAFLLGQRDRNRHYALLLSLSFAVDIFCEGYREVLISLSLAVDTFSIGYRDVLPSPSSAVDMFRMGCREALLSICVKPSTQRFHVVPKLMKLKSLLGLVCFFARICIGLQDPNLMRGAVRKPFIDVYQFNPD